MLIYLGELMNDKTITIDTISIETEIIEKEKTTDIKKSKFGGLPYWPEHFPYVKKDGKFGKMMAQINFEQLSKVYQIPDFPTTGILQLFFPYQDDMWGLTFDGEPSPNYAFYHENTELPQSSDKNLIKIAKDMEGLPSEEILYFNLRKDTNTLTHIDEYQYRRNFGNETYEDYIYDLDDSDDDESSNGSRFGGFAFFTQSDPRYEGSGLTLDEDWILLLQLDTDDNIMWGDAGVGNWFIRRKDLKNRDFSKILFNWDCY